MEEAPVVRRCADLVKELLEVANEHVRRHQAKPSQSLQLLESEQRRAEGSEGQLSSQDRMANSSPRDVLHSEQGTFRMQSALDILQPSIGFNNNGGTSTSMNEMWAGMMDPMTFEPYTIGGDDGNILFDAPWMMEESNNLPHN